jgi:hypothetical protein
MKLNTILPVLAISIAAQAANANHTPTHQNSSMMEMKSGMFKGVEANSGSVSLSKQGGKYHLKVSDDFKIPTSPAPHWQVIDGKGNTFLLQRFTIVGDKSNRDITLPSYITSVSKVQVWCSFAEVNLGEAKFARTITLK